MPVLQPIADFIKGFKIDLIVWKRFSLKKRKGRHLGLK